MSKEYNFAQELIDFIYHSPSPFHVVNNLRNTLIKDGFSELNMADEWELIPQGKYFTTKNNSALFAFKIGSDEIEEQGFKLISAHSDSPGFKIKPQPDLCVENHFLKLNTEVYGGPILMSWLDRPLSISGRVCLKSEHPLFPKNVFVNFNRPLLAIPSLAIHLNRAVNEGIELNKQKDMLPILGLVNDELEKDNYLLKLLAKELDIDIKEIIDFDLTLYEYEKGCILGANQEFISSAKLDDLAMVHAGLKAITASHQGKGVQMLCIFDNEEVGSVTKQGAGSPVLKNILERICFSLGKNKESYHRAIFKSFMISADMAHSIHPNHVEKHDPVLHPVINKGPVIKIHANQKYTTDGDSGAVFEQICHKAKVPYQKFVNRSDMAGGSTLGNVSTSQIDIRTVDIGNPMLSMHSIRELSGVLDHTYISDVFKVFYEL